MQLYIEAVSTQPFVILQPEVATTNLRQLPRRTLCRCPSTLGLGPTFRPPAPYLSLSARHRR